MPGGMPSLRRSCLPAQTIETSSPYTYLLRWQGRYGSEISLFAWVTVNAAVLFLCSHPIVKGGILMDTAV